MNNYYRINLFKQISQIKLKQPENHRDFKSISENNYYYFKLLKNFAYDLGVKYIWFFNEPHLEITWYSTPEQARTICDFVDAWYDNSTRKDNYEILPPNVSWADWYCDSEKEREFGGKVHSLCADFATLYYEYKKPVDKGKGLEKQIGRTIHRLCNPLGLSYKEETRICFSRGLICLLFQYFSFKKAVWIYRNIFRQKY